MKKGLKLCVCLALSILAGAAFAWCLYKTNSYPMGSDVYGHLFKANFLYEALKNGKLYPVYSNMWYNGIEIFRYWPPLSYYVLAVLMFFTGGNALYAFPVFGGVCLVVSMAGWLCWGAGENRIGAAFTIGLLYFFCPDNLRVFFSEGNVPRIFITALLPFLFYLMWRVIRYKKLLSLLPFTAALCLVTYTHLMISAMTGISIALFCLVYGAANREWRYEAALIADAVISYLLMGFMLISGLSGGLVTQSESSSVETISSWAQEAALSLNPFYRIGNLDLFYFGLVIFMICVLGAVTAEKENAAGFISALLIFFSTTTSMTVFIKLLPLSQVFWMQRFVPMAMCFFGISLLCWKKLRRPVFILFVALAVLDAAPSLQFMKGSGQADKDVYTRIEEQTAPYMLKEAAGMTDNRLALLDISEWGSLPSFYLSGIGEKKVQYSFGWSYQGAETIENIVGVNEAFENGFYEYAFDRLLELGNDTVLVKRDMLPENGAESLTRAAGMRGYIKEDETQEALLYHLDAGGTFGTRSRFDCLAVGKSAQYLCYLYPQFEWAENPFIDDYTAEELEAYNKIYLSGFQYRDKTKAENLLREAAEAGVKIYVDMQHIPKNKLTGKEEFMNVYAQFISFTKRFPILETDNGSQFKLNVSTPDYEVWNTVYLSGLADVRKETYYDDKTHLAYVGTKDSENIVFMGFNPVYYYVNTGDKNLLVFLNELFDEEPGGLPEREIVPLSVRYGYGEVLIESEYDGVNTNIARLDCFTSDRPESTQSNLIVVNKGRTVLTVSYPELGPGLLVSAAGAVILLVFWIFVYVMLSDNKKGMEV